MKKLNFKYVFLSLAVVFAFSSCEDEDPISAGDGNPLNENVINLDATIAAEYDVIGEGTSFDFTVTIPSALSSDATVTAELALDNGAFSTGTATILAGETTATGTITAPADDDVISGTDPFVGAADAATLKASAVLLETLETGNAYTISSNVLDLGVYALVEEPDAGAIGIRMDWIDPDVNDLDLYLLNSGFSTISAQETGSRYEVINEDNADLPDDTYLLGVVSFTAPPAGGTPLVMLITLPDGNLEVFNFTYPEGAGSIIPLSFDKVTDAETGVITYENFTVL